MIRVFLIAAEHLLIAHAFLAHVVAVLAEQLADLVVKLILYGEVVIDHAGDEFAMPRPGWTSPSIAASAS